MLELQSGNLLRYTLVCAAPLNFGYTIQLSSEQTPALEAGNTMI